MKCDELKAFNMPRYAGEFTMHEVYLKSDVDAAIDELKSANHKERHEYIKMIAELKQKLENAQAIAYAESVDAGMENRRLKRALWLARSEIAHKKIDEYWPDYCHNAHSRIALLKWEEVERKCRAKAEKYK